MRKLQVWGLMLWIAKGNDGVESFPLTTGYNVRTSEVIERGFDSLLSTNSIKSADGPLFLSSSGESSVSIPDLEGGSPLDAEKDGDEQINKFDGAKKDSIVNESADSERKSNGPMRLTLRGSNFARNERWLEDATAKILDLSVFPLGSFSEDDVVAVTDLMIAWSRRKSVEAAVVVERLLKRVVDDMRAGNGDVYVSTEMYVVAMEAWGTSDEDAGAERAQNIHDAMVQAFRQIENPLIRPTTKSYNTLILAWAKSRDPSALAAAEKTFLDMLTASESKATKTVRPDATTITTMLDLYARNNCEESITKAERLVSSMPALKVEKDISVYSALQDVYVQSGTKDAPQKSFSVLKEMIELSSLGNTMVRPETANYNNVLTAYSRDCSKNSAFLARQMLSQMELPKEDGGYDVDPDGLSYSRAILACSRCPQQTLGARLAEPILKRMEELSTKDPSVSLNIECFTEVLMALTKSRDSDAADRAFSILSRMEGYANEGQEHLRPTTRTMNTALFALHRVGNITAVQRAEETMDAMFQMHKNGVPNIRPDNFSYTAILRLYQRLGTPEAAKRANEILLRMEELYEKGRLNFAPDAYHYTIVCATWSLSRSKNAPEKCIELLSTMKKRDEEGRRNVRPNIRTYNAILDCLSRSHLADRAEMMLYHMLSLAKDGDVNARPDAFSFDSVINAFLHSDIRDAGRRAESVLERGLEYAEEDSGQMLETRSFENILRYYGAQTTVMDSPYRAKYVLDRLISLYKAGFTHLSPRVSSFTFVMEAYVAQRHREAGECAEELLTTMAKLRRQYNCSDMEVNTGVMNRVLHCWANSLGHDDAGNRAENLLDLMVEKSGSGSSNMTPNARSYNLVIETWWKSNCPNKAERALGILERVKRDGYLHRTPEYSYGQVIRACAYSETFGPRIEKRAFEIAVRVMGELLEDVPTKRPEPNVITYAWFFQACGRLRVPEASKASHIRRIFSRCCEKGRFSEFVLKSLKSCTSDAQFNELMAETISKKRAKKNLKQTIQLSDLPKSWIYIEDHTRTKRKYKFREASKNRNIK